MGVPGARGPRAGWRVGVDYRSSGVVGDVCIRSGGRLSMTGGSFSTNVRLDSGATFQQRGGGKRGTQGAVAGGGSESGDYGRRGGGRERGRPGVHAQWSR